MAFNWLKQTAAVTAMNVRNIPARPGASAVAVIGVAAVVGVFTAVLSMAVGFQKTMRSAGSEDTAVLLRGGATSELNSGLSFEQTQIIGGMEGIRKDNGDAIVSPELYVLVDVPKISTGTPANVPLRGVTPNAFAVRDNVSISEGRSFEPGRAELVVGRSAQLQFAGLNLGDVVEFSQVKWTVVGTFVADGSVSESEIWCDVRVLQPAYQRGNNYQSVRVKLDGPAGLETLRAVAEADPRVNVDVELEPVYYSSQSGALTVFIKAVGYPVTILMAIGAIFGALNTMYSSVSARTREIATLRAIGFGPASVALSTILESLLLALVGGVIGSLITYFLFNGFTVSTLNGASFSQVVFAFAVTGELLVQGLIAALVIGLIGGLFPAIRAARLPVVTALREL